MRERKKAKPLSDYSHAYKSAHAMFKAMEAVRDIFDVQRINPRHNEQTGRQTFRAWLHDAVKRSDAYLAAYFRFAMDLGLHFTRDINQSVLDHMSHAIMEYAEKHGLPHGDYLVIWRWDKGDDTAIYFTLREVDKIANLLSSKGRPILRTLDKMLIDRKKED